MNAPPDNQKYLYQSLTAAMFAELDNRPDLAKLFVDFAVALACRGVDVKNLKTNENEVERRVIQLQRTAAA